VPLIQKTRLQMGKKPPPPPVGETQASPRYRRSGRSEAGSRAGGLGRLAGFPGGFRGDFWPGPWHLGLRAAHPGLGCFLILMLFCFFAKIKTCLIPSFLGWFPPPPPPTFQATRIFLPPFPPPVADSGRCGAPPGEFPAKVGEFVKYFPVPWETGNVPPRYVGNDPCLTRGPGKPNSPPTHGPAGAFFPANYKRKVPGPGPGPRPAPLFNFPPRPPGPPLFLLCAPRERTKGLHRPGPFFSDEALVFPRLFSSPAPPPRRGGFLPGASPLTSPIPAP